MAVPTIPAMSDSVKTAIFAAAKSAGFDGRVIYLKRHWRKNGLWHPSLGPAKCLMVWRYMILTTAPLGGRRHEQPLALPHSICPERNGIRRSSGVIS